MSIQSNFDNIENIMATIFPLLTAVTYAPVKIGDTYTTHKSGVTGVVAEIVPNNNGTWRVRLETDNGDRWTTVVP
jgi:hypothetical protein